MSVYQRELKQAIEMVALERGRFTLASGQTSSYYLDLRKVTVSPLVRWIGEILRERILDSREEFPHCIGGMATGAIPLVTATVMSYSYAGRELDGFWVRDRFKEHGTHSLIEGDLRGCERAVIVEDVITSGQSTMRAIEAARQVGLNVVRVIALVDRLAGAEDLLRSQGVPHYESIFTIRDFGITP